MADIAALLAAIGMAAVCAALLLVCALAAMLCHVAIKDLNWKEDKGDES